MRSRASLVALLLAAVLFAGCSDSTEETETTGPETLQAGRGAIAGLVIDDVYRPIPNALILLQELGLTATTDGDGQFRFVDLQPGSYLLRIEAEGHEGSPTNVDVVAGEYAEPHIVARRIFSAGGSIITAEFSAFIPCAADFIVNGVVANCLGDLSGDSYRAGFTTKNLTYPDITYLVTEVRMNNVGDYNVQVREDDGSSAGGDRYAVGQIKQGDYLKMVNEYNVTNTVHNEQDNNVPWTGSKPFQTIVFYQGAMRDEVGGADDELPVSPLCCGVGAQFGIKAKFVQSIFLGQPERPIEEYCVLASTCA